MSEQEQTSRVDEDLSLLSAAEQAVFSREMGLGKKITLAITLVVGSLTLAAAVYYGIAQGFDRIARIAAHSYVSGGGEALDEDDQ